MEENNTTSELYASLPRRIKAGIVDTVIVLFLFIILPVSIQVLIPDENIFSVFFMYSPILILEPILISYLGATIGQYLFGVEVVRKKDYGKCPILLSFARYFTKIIFGSFSVVYMLFSRRHQAIHDHLAGTLVILSRKRVKTNPDFASYGEQEQFSGSEYVYPSALRRFFVFIVWYIIASILFGILFEIFVLAVIPEYSADTESYPEAIDIASNLLISMIFIGLAILAAKGQLFGARRRKSVE